MGLEIAFCSSVLIPEGKGQVGDEMEQSALCRSVSRRSTISPNHSKCEEAEGQSRKFERLNPSPSPTQFALESEWAKVEAVLNEATRRSRETELIRDNMLLECFYRGLGPENRLVGDQISLGGLTRLPFAIAAHLLDRMAKTNKDTEKDKVMATLLTQLDLVAKKIMELEATDKKKDWCIPPHERVKSKVYEG
uniref:Uncharacterized protein n=1 Tax=Solanum tuberosum TaxID=4113 RepID=M1DLF5_SOLTU